MPVPVLVLQRSALASRWAARAPRIALYVALGVLALGGVRAIVSPRPGPPRPVIPAQKQDLAAEALAAQFARAYLTYDAAHPELRERALKPFATSELDIDVGFAAPSSGARRVLWSTPVQ